MHGSKGNNNSLFPYKEVNKAVPPEDERLAGVSHERVVVCCVDGKLEEEKRPRERRKGEELSSQDKSGERERALKENNKQIVLSFSLLPLSFVRV